VSWRCFHLVRPAGLRLGSDPEQRSAATAPKGRASARTRVKQDPARLFVPNPTALPSGLLFCMPVWVWPSPQRFRPLRGPRRDARSASRRPDYPAWRPSLSWRKIRLGLYIWLGHGFSGRVAVKPQWQ